ncbi:hypothetical protein [Paragemmobacter straminiformis]|uniref:Uncharacterized protein n=1 Tax=Paragemmobacter straminiformis TaxID=2045119 RepID=A0A842I7Y9_9RHOB|nr:hypothetical protein [Gemmobacter straminiformis]MBC2835108.1 hypothetical protein [Gemmobacter straminiformis]
MEETLTNPRTASVFIAIFIIFFISLQTFIAEYRAVLLTTGTTNDVISALAETGDAWPHPASSRSVRDILSICGRLLLLSPRLKSDPALAEAVSTNCNHIANDFLARSPRNGRAMAVALLTSKRIEADRLAAAQVAAPYEPWPLNVRLQIVSASADLTPEVAALARADIGRAMLSHWGREALATLYITHDRMRPLIAGAADAAAPADQRAFLDLLRRETGAGS